MSTPGTRFAPPPTIRTAPLQLLGAGAFYCVLMSVLGTSLDLAHVWWVLVMEAAVIFGMAGIASMAIARNRMTLTADGVQHEDWRRSGFIAFADVVEIDTRWWRLRLKTHDGRTVNLGRPLIGGAELFRQTLRRIRATNPDVVYDEKKLMKWYIALELYDRRVARLGPFFGSYSFVVLCLGLPLMGFAHWPMLATFGVALYAEMILEGIMIRPRLKKQLDLDSLLPTTIEPSVRRRQTIIVTLLALATLLLSWWMWFPTASC